MCKEMPVIPANRVLDPKRIIGKNGGGRQKGSLTGLPDFSWYKIPKRGKIYQMTTKYTK
jgi:hypothetical protein